MDEFEAVFLTDVWVFYVVYRAEEHMEWAHVDSAVVIEGLVDHHGLAGFGVRGGSDDPVEVLVPFLFFFCQRFSLEVLYDVAGLEGPGLHFFFHLVCPHFY